MNRSKGWGQLGCIGICRYCHHSVVSLPSSYTCVKSFYPLAGIITSRFPRSIKLMYREVCNRARAKELAQMKLIQEKFPHRHVSTLQRNETKPIDLRR
jgi:hypothetical protein